MPKKGGEKKKPCNPEGFRSYRASRGTGRNRTADTTIFSRVLYRLSYSPLLLELPNITAFPLIKKATLAFIYHLSDEYPEDVFATTAVRSSNFLPGNMQYQFSCSPHF